MVKHYYPMLVILFLMLAPLVIGLINAPLVAKDLREMIPAEHLARGGGWTWYGSHGSFLSTLVYAGVAKSSGIPAQNSTMLLLIPFAVCTFIMIYLIALGLFDNRGAALLAMASFTIFPAYARFADMRPSILGILFALYAIHIMLKHKRIPWEWAVITLMWSPGTAFFLFVLIAAVLSMEYVIPDGTLRDRFIMGSVFCFVSLVLIFIVVGGFDLGSSLNKYAWSLEKDIGWVYIPLVAPFWVGYIADGFKDKRVLVGMMVLLCIPLHPWIYAHVWSNGLTMPDEFTIRGHGFPGEPGYSMYSYPVHAYYIMNRFEYHSPVGKQYPGVQFGDGMPELLEWFRAQPVEYRYVSLCMYHNNFNITYMDGCHGQDPVTRFEFIPKYSGVLPATEVPLGDIIQMYLSATDRDRLLAYYDVDYLLVTENEEMMYSPMSICSPVFEHGNYKVYDYCGYQDPWVGARYGIVDKRQNDTFQEAIDSRRYCIVDPVDGCLA